MFCWRQCLAPCFCYAKSKARPHGSVQEFIHDVLLRLPPITSWLEGASTLGVDPGRSLRLTRELSERGRFMLKSEPELFPPQPSRQDAFEFDVCISFTGQNRAIAEEIAKALLRSRTGFKLKVFYDEFEKLRLGGRSFLTSFIRYTQRNAGIAFCCCRPITTKRLGQSTSCGPRNPGFSSNARAICSRSFWTTQSLPSRSIP